MKRHHRNLLLIISLFFTVFAFVKELQCCSDKRVYAGNKETQIVRVSGTKVAHGSISQMSKARGVYGGDSMVRPRGKKNKAIASTTRSASVALLQVTTVTLVQFFLY